MNRPGVIDCVGWHKQSLEVSLDGAYSLLSGKSGSYQNQSLLLGSKFCTRQSSGPTVQSSTSFGHVFTVLLSDVSHFSGQEIPLILLGEVCCKQLNTRASETHGNWHVRRAGIGPQNQCLL